MGRWAACRRHLRSWRGGIGAAARPRRRPRGGRSAPTQCARAAAGCGARTPAGLLARVSPGHSARERRQAPLQCIDPRTIQTPGSWLPTPRRAGWSARAPSLAPSRCPPSPHPRLPTPLETMHVMYKSRAQKNGSARAWARVLVSPFSALFGPPPPAGARARRRRPSPGLTSYEGDVKCVSILRVLWAAPGCARGHAMVSRRGERGSSAGRTRAAAAWRGDGGWLSHSW